MSDTELETTLCIDCGIPVEMPKPRGISFFHLQYVEVPRCKDCLAKAKETYLTEHFSRAHLCQCPYKIPHWRPKV